MNRQYGALSGVAIFLIVLNHAIHFGLEVSPVDGVTLNVLIVLQALGSFAVPVFLFVSGAFLTYAAAELSFTFVERSLGRILWPYVFWSAIFYVLVFLTDGERNTIAGYGKNLLVGYPYHFVPLLIFWYLAAPFVLRLGKRFGVWLVIAVGIGQTILLILRFPSFFGVPEPLPEWTRPFRLPVLFTSMSDWAIYFPLGIVLSVHSTVLKSRLLRLRWLAVSAVGGLFLLGILNAFEMVHAPWARLVGPLPLMFLLPIVNRSSIPLVGHFEFLGRRGYGIYLAHFVVISLAVSAVGELGPSFGVVFIVPVFMVFALGSVLLAMDLLAKATPGRKIYRHVFGIVPPPVGIRRAARGERLPSQGRCQLLANRSATPMTSAPSTSVADAVRQTTAHPTRNTGDV